MLRYFPGDNLFSPLERRRGLPLGTQTSQFFANVYLDPLDQFIRRELKPGSYARYVDDFLLFDSSREALEDMRARIVDLLEGLRLRIHAGKSRVYRSADGVTFLGWQVFPRLMRLAPANMVRFRRKLRATQRSHAAGLMGMAEVKQRVQA